MDNIVAVVIGFALTTVAGGWWAARLQRRAWQEQNDVRLREAAIEHAGSTCQTLTSLLDRRLYRMQRLLWAARDAGRGPGDRAELERRLQEYVEVLIDWNERLNMHLSLVGGYFGDAARADLDALYESYKDVGSRVEAVVRSARAGEDVSPAVTAVAAEFDGREAGTLNDRVYRFGLLLMTQIRDGAVGRHAPGAALPRPT